MFLLNFRVNYMQYISYRTAKLFEYLYISFDDTLKMLKLKYFKFILQVTCKF